MLLCYMDANVQSALTHMDAALAYKVAALTHLGVAWAHDDATGADLGAAWRALTRAGYAQERERPSHIKPGLGAR